MKKLLFLITSLLITLSLFSQEAPNVISETALLVDEVILEIPPFEYEYSSSLQMEDDGTISIDFPDEDARTAVRSIAGMFDLNLIIPNSFTGRTSVKLRSVSWQQAFEIILEPLGYTFEIDRAVVSIQEIEKEEEIHSLPETGTFYSPIWLIPLIPTAIIHIALAVSILRDSIESTLFLNRRL